MSYRIAMDSCGEPTPEMIAGGKVVTVPLTIRVGDQEFVDDETFDQRTLLDAIAAYEGCPGSACPSPGAFLDRFGRDADRVYAVTMSGALSGSYNSALLASRMFEDENPGKRCHVFNSCSASVGQTLISALIIELEEAGKDFDEIVEEVEAYIAAQHTYFVLDNLETLRKNGRLSRLKTFMATRLNVKPVLGATDEGTIQQLDTARGSNRALLRMTELAIRDLEPGAVRRAAISHCNCPARAKLVKDCIMNTLAPEECIVLDTRGIASLYANEGGVILVL